MSATSASAPPQDDAGAGRPRTIGPGLLLTLVAALVLLGVASWLGDSMIPVGYERVAQVLALAAPAAAVILLVAGVLLPRLAARRQRSLATEAVTWIGDLDATTGQRDLDIDAEDEDEDAEDEDVDEAEAAGENAEPLDFSTRVLQMQVRSLESTLEEQHRRLEDVRRAAHRQFAAAARRDRERVLLTVQALRDTVGEQSGLGASDRIEAALSRIGADTSFARPRLVAGSSRSPHVPLGSPQPAATQTPPPQAAPAQTAAAPIAGPQPAPAGGAKGPPSSGPAAGAPAPTAPAAPSTPVEPVVKQPARVLPVPAPEPAAPETRSRRRSRRPADA